MAKASDIRAALALIHGSKAITESGAPPSSQVLNDLAQYLAPLAADGLGSAAAGRLTEAQHWLMEAARADMTSRQNAWTKARLSIALAREDLDQLLRSLEN